MRKLAQQEQHSRSAASPTEVGAIVAGGDFLGLAIVRSLGRRGVPVCVIDDEFSIARFSKYAKHVAHVAEFRREHDIVNGVMDVGKRLGLQGWVLFPTREEMVAAFSKERDRLASFFRVSTPEWANIQWAWDKRNTYRLANALGVPIPRTWYIHEAADLQAIDCDGPFTIKPAIKEHFVYRTKQKAWRANSRAELRTLVEKAMSIVGSDEVMVQEFIPGDGACQTAYCAFFNRDTPLGKMTVIRRRQHPPDFGRASTYVQTVELPVIEEMSERLLRAIKFHGLVELEYKFDKRSGEYKLLDFNARAWGYHSLGMSAGVDFPWMVFADQLGLPISPSRAENGMCWIRLVTDLPTGVLEILHRRISVREYLTSLFRFDTESVFCKEDPWPAIAEIALVPYLWVKRGY